jgi:hypothetical protein
VMATVGVKSSRAIGAAAAARGLAIGYFPLLSKGAGELVMGEDDRHLDFRAAILLRATAEGGRELVAVTVVHCHNQLGRAYLAAITTFHRAIVQANSRPLFSVDQPLDGRRPPDFCRRELNAKRGISRYRRPPIAVQCGVSPMSAWPARPRPLTYE